MAKNADANTDAASLVAKINNVNNAAHNNLMQQLTPQRIVVGQPPTVDSKSKIEARWVQVREYWKEHNIGATISTTDETLFDILSIFFAHIGHISGQKKLSGDEAIIERIEWFHEYLFFDTLRELRVCAKQAKDLMKTTTHSYSDAYDLACRFIQKYSYQQDEATDVIFLEADPKSPNDIMDCKSMQVPFSYVPTTEQVAQVKSILEHLTPDQTHQFLKKYLQIEMTTPGACPNVQMILSEILSGKNKDSRMDEDSIMDGGENWTPLDVGIVCIFSPIFLAAAVIMSPIVAYTYLEKMIFHKRFVKQINKESDIEKLRSLLYDRVAKAEKRITENLKILMTASPFASPRFIWVKHTNGPISKYQVHPLHVKDGDKVRICMHIENDGLVPHDAEVVDHIGRAKFTTQTKYILSFYTGHWFLHFNGPNGVITDLYLTTGPIASPTPIQHIREALRDVIIQSDTQLKYWWPMAGGSSSMQKRYIIIKANNRRYLVRKDGRKTYILFGGKQKMYLSELKGKYKKTT